MRMLPHLYEGRFCAAIDSLSPARPIGSMHTSSRKGRNLKIAFCRAGGQGYASRELKETPQNLSQDDLTEAEAKRRNCSRLLRPGGCGDDEPRRNFSPSLIQQCLPYIESRGEPVLI